SRWGVAHHFFRDVSVGVAVLAERPQIVLAAPTFTAGDRERDNNAVADLELLHVPADFHHLAHELMAEDVAVLHGRNEAVEEMKVGSANGGRSDANDCIALVKYPGIGHILDLDVLGALPAIGP